MPLSNAVTDVEPAFTLLRKHADFLYATRVHVQSTYLIWRQLGRKDCSGIAAKLIFLFFESISKFSNLSFLMRLCGGR